MPRRRISVPQRSRSRTMYSPNWAGDMGWATAPSVSSRCAKAASPRMRLQASFSLTTIPAGVLGGAVTVVMWKQFSWFGLYEIVPGFVFASLAIIVFSLNGAPPSRAMRERFDAVSEVLAPGY